MQNYKYSVFLLFVVALGIICPTAIFGQSKPKLNSMGYAPINGLEMYYEIHGAANSAEPPLVLLHGGGSTIETTFGKTLALFAKNRRVIAFEQQGHGHTRDVDRPFSFEQSADDAAELMKFLKIFNADFFGFSNGGNILYYLAIRHPELVRKLVFASASAKHDGFPAEFWESMKSPKLEDMPLALREAYLKTSPHPQKLQIFFDKGAKRMQEFKDLPDEAIRSITVPTLIIIGDKDNVRPEHAVAMFRLLPDARLAILPSSHGGYLGGAAAKKGGWTPAMTVALVEEFLDASPTTKK